MKKLIALLLAACLLCGCAAAVPGSSFPQESDSLSESSFPAESASPAESSISDETEPAGEAEPLPESEHSPESFPAAAATGVPLPQALADQLAGITGETAVEWGSELYQAASRSIVYPYYDTSLITVAWADASDIPADNLLRMYAVHHFDDRPGDETVTVSADEVEAYIRQYFAVSADWLRTGTNYDADGGCYRFHGMDGLGGVYPDLTRITRLSDTDYRFVLEYGESTREYYNFYHAIVIRVLDGSFSYVCGEGELAY